MEYKICPNCTKKLDGLMTTRRIIRQTTTDFINSYHSTKSEAYCSNCAPGLITQYKEDNNNKIETLNNSIIDEISIIPIITLHNPNKWDYDILEMISAQSISGTGFLTELTSSWSDLTGGQSSSMASKISNGEDICKAKLRYQCVLLGGNAIIGTDIDYAEVGGAKGMLMVCMAGTAVKVESNKLALSKLDKFNAIEQNAKELAKLKSVKYPDTDYAL